jgi:uncharacterized protein YndB with AHSA1/START domain
MSTPHVPLRLELTVELPGTPQQVWDAIATAAGISSWFIPTDVEEHEGGSIVFHMGETDSPGTITGWEPPGRLAYEEPDWAQLTSNDPSTVTPLATELLVEARSGGTCVVRMVSSAFGSGADWEQEFFDEMEKGWTPFFDHLRLYLTHFPGQTATTLSAETDVKADALAVTAAMREALGVDRPAQAVDVRGLGGRVETLDEQQVLVRLDDGQLPGYLAFFAFDKGDGVATAQVAGYLFSADAPAYVAREQGPWTTWLQALQVSAP